MEDELNSVLEEKFGLKIAILKYNVFLANWLCVIFFLNDMTVLYFSFLNFFTLVPLMICQLFICGFMAYLKKT